MPNISELVRVETELTEERMNRHQAIVNDLKFSKATREAALTQVRICEAILGISGKSYNGGGEM